MGNGQCCFVHDCVSEYRSVRLRELLESERYFKDSETRFDLESFEEVFGYFLGDSELHFGFYQELREPFVLASLLGDVGPRRALQFIFDLYANSAGVQNSEAFRRMANAVKRVVQSALGRTTDEERVFQGTFDEFWHSLQDDVGLMEYLDSIFALRSTPLFLGKKEDFNEDAAKVLMMEEDYETERIRPSLFTGKIKPKRRVVPRCGDPMEGVKETHAVVYNNKLVTFADLINKQSTNITLDEGAQPFHWLDLVASNNVLDLALTRRFDGKIVSLLNSHDFLRLLYNMPDLFGDWWFAPIDKFLLRKPRDSDSSTPLRIACSAHVTLVDGGRGGSASPETIRKIYVASQSPLPEILEMPLASRPRAMRYAAPVFDPSTKLSDAITESLTRDDGAIDRFHIFSSSSHVADLLFVDLARFILDRH